MTGGEPNEKHQTQPNTKRVRCADREGSAEAEKKFGFMYVRGQ